MTSVQGKDVLVSVMADNGTTLLEVEHQDDATYNPGKTLNKIKHKNATSANFTEEGEQITFSFAKQRPLSLGQNRIFELAKSEEAAICVYNDEKTGGHKREGLAKFSVGEESAGVDGLVNVPITVVFVGTVSEDVNS